MQLRHSPVFLIVVFTIIIVRSSGASSAKAKHSMPENVSKSSHDIGLLLIGNQLNELNSRNAPNSFGKKEAFSFKKGEQKVQQIKDKESKNIGGKVGGLSVVDNSLNQKSQNNILNIDSAKAMNLSKKNEEHQQESNQAEPQKPCQVDVLKYFGMSQDRFFEFARKSTIEVKSYCRRNLYTCCSVEHIKSVTNNFQSATKKLIKLFEPVEELLILFKGPVYKNFINEIRGDETCISYVEEMMASNAQNAYDFLDPKNIQERNEEIFSLLVDLEYYIKNQIWFYGNLVCTICNPDQNMFFDVKLARPRVKALINTCSDVLESYDFELRLAKLYNSFLKPLADLIICHTDIMNEGEVHLSYIPQQDIDDMERKFRSCYSNLNGRNRDCIEICSKSLTSFAPNIDILTPMKEALRIIFRKLTKQNIVDYYREIKKEDFEDVHLQTIFFFSQSWSRFKSQETTAFSWTFSNSGANIYNNHIAKKFYHDNNRKIRF